MEDLKEISRELEELMRKKGLTIDEKENLDSIISTLDNIRITDDMSKDNIKLLSKCKRVITSYKEYSSIYNAVKTRITFLLDTYSRKEYEVIINWKYVDNSELKIDRKELNSKSPQLKLNFSNKDIKKEIIRLITTKVLDTKIGKLEMSSIVGTHEERFISYCKSRIDLDSIDDLSMNERIDMLKDYVNNSMEFGDNNGFFFMDKASNVVRFTTSCGREAKNLFLSMTGTNYEGMLNPNRYLYSIPYGIDNNTNIIDNKTVGKIKVPNSNNIHVSIEYDKELYDLLLKFFTHNYIVYARKRNESLQKSVRTTAVPNLVEKNLESLFVNKQRFYTPLLILSNNVVNPYIIIPNVTWDLLLDENRIKRDQVHLTSNSILDDYPRYFKTKIDFEVYKSGVLMWDLNSKGNRLNYPKAEGTIFIQTKEMCRFFKMKYIKPNWNFLLTFISKEFENISTGYRLSDDYLESVKQIKQNIISNLSKEMDEFGISKRDLLSTEYTDIESFNKMLDFLDSVRALRNLSTKVYTMYIKDSYRNNLIHQLTTRYYSEDNTKYFGNVTKEEFMRCVGSMMDNNRYKDYDKED